MNSYIRCKLALTEDNPTIKPYFEERWAELHDGKETPVASSLNLLEGLHIRWVALLISLTEQELTKTFVHPEHGKRYNYQKLWRYMPIMAGTIWRRLQN